jgi:hypothetical protein
MVSMSAGAKSGILRAGFAPRCEFLALAEAGHAITIGMFDVTGTGDAGRLSGGPGRSGTNQRYQ